MYTYAEHKSLFTSQHVQLCQAQEQYSDRGRPNDKIECFFNTFYFTQ